MSKTMVEHTDEVLETILYCDLRTSVGIDKAKTTIRRALKKAYVAGHDRGGRDAMGITNNSKGE